MACKVDNNAYEVDITPQRKRKREPETPQPLGLTNAGFCSTPKRQAKLLIDSFSNLSSTNNINVKNPFTNSCLEVKSIAEIADSKSTCPENPYEITRKPPKKRKKHNVKEACFVNPALNLEFPERKLNPFEVKRADPVAKENNNCFINSGLNIRTEENNLAVNPFEISRHKSFESSKEGIENPALEIPTSLTIEVPFQPTIGCRIDFSGVSLQNLTPSRLLAEKLVFSPDTGFNGKTPNKNVRRSLSVISEETLDIGKELDCYQLELENSINEAKIRKNGFEQRLQNVEESVEERIEEMSYSFTSKQEEKGTNTSPGLTSLTPESKVVEENQTGNTKEINKHELEEINAESVSSGSENEPDEIDFKAPAPFVRSYRKPCQQKLKTSCKINIPVTQSKENEPKSTLTSAIRRSFRKFIHPAKSADQAPKSERKEQESSHLFNSIRQSLRGKQKNETKATSDEKGYQLKPNNDSEIADNQEKENIDFNDISVVDSLERKVFRSITKGEDYTKTDEVVFEKRATLRSSFRKTGKGIRNQILKSVFHKKVDEYNLNE